MATNRKLGRTTNIRMAMLKNLTTDLLVHGKIETTLPRAKEVKSIADSIISLAIKENITEELKEKDQMKWVGLMNNISNIADEIVIKKYVYEE